uniref:Uncharacterized protein n=1 Tax=Parastrongyloides trichosuri TaxID=131310 RepID=A0A0N4Z465_PARTI
MNANSELKIRLIDPREKERLLAEERQRRRLLRMKEAKEQANLFSKIMRENKTKFNYNNNKEQPLSKMHQKYTYKEDNNCEQLCPRLKRYFQILERKNNKGCNVLIPSKFNYKNQIINNLFNKKS